MFVLNIIFLYVIHSIRGFCFEGRVDRWELRFSRFIPIFFHHFGQKNWFSPLKNESTKFFSLRGYNVLNSKIFANLKEFGGIALLLTSFIELNIV